MRARGGFRDVSTGPVTARELSFTIARREAIRSIMSSAAATPAHLAAARVTAWRRILARLHPRRATRPRPVRSSTIPGGTRPPGAIPGRHPGYPHARTRPPAPVRTLRARQITGNSGRAALVITHSHDQRGKAWFPSVREPGAKPHPVPVDHTVRING